VAVTHQPTYVRLARMSHVAARFVGSRSFLGIGGVHIELNARLPPEFGRRAFNFGPGAQPRIAEQFSCRVRMPNC